MYVPGVALNVIFQLVLPDVATNGVPTTLFPDVIAKVAETSGTGVGICRAPRSVRVTWYVPAVVMLKVSSTGTAWVAAATVCTTFTNGCEVCAIELMQTNIHAAARARAPLVHDMVGVPQFFIIVGYGSGNVGGTRDDRMTIPVTFFPRGTSGAETEQRTAGDDRESERQKHPGHQVLEIDGQQHFDHVEQDHRFRDTAREVGR